MNILNQKFDPAYPLEKLRTHERNARQGDAGAIHESIAGNGFYGALVVQKSTGKILAGNHRYLVAKSLGATTVPVIFVNVDDSQALKILVGDNRISDLGHYDEAALAELLDSVRMDAGLEGTGWDDDSYQNLLDDLKGIALGDLSSDEPQKKPKAAKDDIVRPEVFDGPNPTKKDKPGEQGAGTESTAIATRFQVLVDCADELEQSTVLGMLEARGTACRKLG